jgi:NAD(P)-dependent dehydrogenase (short-subunit alcohol dehydrogenase family)
MSKRLDGRIAIVTGAAGGMGKVVARRFAQEGAVVALTDVNEDSLRAAASEIQSRGGHVLALAADVTRVAAIESFIEAVGREFGAIDILYNNAGVSVSRSIEEQDEALWDKTFAINVKAYFFMVRASLPFLRRSHHAAIINVGSVSGTFGLANMAAYCTSKAAVHQLTKAMAVELAPARIRVNAIAPGVVETEMVSNAFIGMTETQRLEVVNGYTARQLFRRMADPEEIAAIAAFLASDEASFLTGEIVNASAGWAAN